MFSNDIYGIGRHFFIILLSKFYKVKKSFEDILFSFGLQL